MATSIGKHSYACANMQVLWKSDEAQLYIGDYCSIASNVIFMLGGNHRVDWISTYPFNVFFDEAKSIKGQPCTKGNIIVGNDVWIGTNVTVLSGVTIGDGAVIGMNATVTKNVPPYSIVAGNPARVVKYRFSEDRIKKLLKIKWWEKNDEWIKKNCRLLCSNGIDELINMFYPQNIEKLTNKYNQAKNNVSDIYEFIPIFREYAKKCKSITEFGIRDVVSSWGFAMGLSENGGKTKKMIGVDLKWNKNIEELEKICKENNIDYKFIQGNSANVSIDSTDILFIDTWHVYGHLKRELENHYSSVRKYIMMHDTNIDGENGESIRNNWSIHQQSIESGYSEEEIKTGLNRAITEFLNKHDEWTIEKKYENCNGLTILKRRE